MNRNPRLQKWWDNNCSIEGASKNKKRRLPIDRPTSSEEEQLLLLPHESPDPLVPPPKSPEVFISFLFTPEKGFQLVKKIKLTM